MNVLAFDTCLGAVSVAVRWRNAHGEWLLRDACEARTTGHAERLFPMIAALMQDAELAFASLDRIAVTLGPGTFTGVRVGVAAARAFALAGELPVVGISSLAAVAHHANFLIGPERGSRPLAVAVDARRDKIYFQVFGNDATRAEGAQLLAIDDAAEMIGERPTLIVGSAAAAVATRAGRNAEARLPDLQPHARSLAILAPDLAPLERVTPLYFRQPDVKPQMNKVLPGRRPLQG
jgi:tRNA threonylcarbamoyladenosine biosynthesis protein TsaB